MGEVLDNRRATSALHRPWVVLAGAPGVVLVRGQSEVGLVGGVVPSSWDMEQHGPSVGWDGSIHEAAWAHLALHREVLEEYYLEVVGR